MQDQAVPADEPPWDRSASDVIDHIGCLIDASCDTGQQDGARLAIQRCERLRGVASLTDKESALLDYYEANACDVLAPCSTANSAEAWKWTDVSRDNQIRLLRRAQRSPGFTQLGRDRRAEIFTNLANALDTQGRFVEAVELYGKAVEASPDHGMAHGNFGLCLETYGRTLCTQMHPVGCCPLTAFMARAWVHLVAALNSPLPPAAARVFSDARLRLEEDLRKFAEGEVPTLPGGRLRRMNKKERRRRDWCLDKCLFLNPLNDLDDLDKAATDILLLPPIVHDPADGQFVLSLFNEVKELYVSARLCLYEGLENKKTHFEDRDVLLVNTLDCSAHSSCLEKVKDAFRRAYSVFDKVAFLLNGYLELGIEPKRVNCRTMWYEKEDSRAELKPCFRHRQNLPLRGLFGLSRDFSGVSNGRDALDPDAQELVSIRHYLEHKHLSVHEDSWIGSGRGCAGESEDKRSFAIGRRDLEARSLRVLKLARSALVYLAHAVAIEEESRASRRSATDVIIPLVFPLADSRGRS